ncbi:MAG: CD225/dispanin family protein [Paramuribaculum sp.]|nr:DUF4339 domain-containing protein [Bacteroides sp.]MBD5376277.1 DUF4339 domain-containing protein [Bacteroides sp.]MDE7459555.1 CD225/dispanin family protein [Paramuribaculum sp.]
MNENTTYWMMQGGVRLGPMSFDELVRRIASPSTPVWREGMADWCAAENLPELSGFFRTAAPRPHVNSIYGIPAQPNARPETAWHPPVETTEEAMPPTYLAWSIVAMLVCCIVTGIVALIYSTKVSSRWTAGDYEGARKASSAAQMWIIVTVVCGLIAIPFQVILALL